MTVDHGPFARLTEIGRLRVAMDLAEQSQQTSLETLNSAMVAVDEGNKSLATEILNEGNSAASDLTTQAMDIVNSRR